ncbi:hypothetical protein AB0N09_05815 [Streptomyces erythrochromogenes]|uniref:hypothetical protein n=1 Tax=Streptomyces erythrochromogenes TaxID=285574 RepID=UPI003424A8D6
MGVQDTEEQESPGELENLFDAPEGGAAADPFASWGESGAAAPTAQSIPPRPETPIPGPAARHPQPVRAAYAQDADVEEQESRGAQSGFRVSQEVSDRLKDYRQANDLTVSEVVIEALDHVAEEVPEVIARAKMPARVTPTRSRFAARGSKGPLKGTGPVQRWWTPTKDDKSVVKEMAMEAGLRETPGILIAVALNEFLPGGAMYIAGQLRTQIREDQAFQVPTDLVLARTYNVSREVARQALVQLQVEGLIPVDSE